MRSLAPKRAISLAIILSLNARADGYLFVEPNSSYLCNTKYSGESAGLDILDHNRQIQLSQQRADAVRMYEAKSAAGTLTLADQVNYTNSMSAFGQNVFNEIKNYQQSSNTNKLVTALKKNEDLVSAERTMKYPAAIIGGGLSIYNGTSYTVYKTQGFSVTPGESIKNKSASLAVSSIILNANVAANAQSITTSVNRGLIDHVSVSFTNTIQSPNSPANIISFNYGIPL